MSDFLPSPNSLKGATSAPLEDEKPVVRSADGVPVSLATVQGLEAYLEQRMDGMRAELAANTNKAIQTVIPDVLELHQANMAQGSTQGSMVHVPQSIPQGNQDSTALIALAGVCLVSLAAMGGVLWGSVQSPGAATQRTNQQLINQIQGQNQQILRSNEQLQDSQQRCPRVAVFAPCNIGE